MFIWECCWCVPVCQAAPLLLWARSPGNSARSHLHLVSTTFTLSHTLSHSMLPHSLHVLSHPRQLTYIETVCTLQVSLTTQGIGSYNTKQTVSMHSEINKTGCTTWAAEHVMFVAHAITHSICLCLMCLWSVVCTSLKPTINQQH